MLGNACCGSWDDEVKGMVPRGRMRVVIATCHVEEAWVTGTLSMMLGIEDCRGIAEDNQSLTYAPWHFS